MATTTQTLQSEAAKRLPGPFSGPSREYDDHLRGSFDNLWRPSKVAVWAMATQLSGILGAETLGRLTGINLGKFTLLETRTITLDNAETRSLWLLWSLIMCPSNLANTFHLETWGYFNPNDDLWIKKFEKERVRRGFADAVFGSVEDYHDSQAIPGVINYLRQGDLKVMMIDPPIVISEKKGAHKKIPISWLTELFNMLDRGYTQKQVAAALKVTQAYVSILAAERSLILPHMIRTLRTRVRIPTI